MKLLAYAALVTASTLALSAHAGSLDHARELSAAIEKATGGVKVLSATAKDETYTNPEAVKNLETVLSNVLSAKDLAGKSPEAIGARTFAYFSMVTADQDEVEMRKSKHSLKKYFVWLDSQRIKGNFCKLAGPECDLFSKEITQGICAEGK